MMLKDHRKMEGLKEFLVFSDRTLNMRTLNMRVPYIKVIGQPNNLVRSIVTDSDHT